MGVSKTTDHIQIKIKMLNPSQKPPSPSNASNQDLKDMDVQNIHLTKTSDSIQIIVKLSNPNQAPPASTKV